MRAYAFLDPAATDYVSGARWPVPADDGPGEWRDPNGGEPLRACTSDQLVWWIDQMLWEVELAGDVHDTGRSLHGERGRLMAPVDAWSPDVAHELTVDCAVRLRDRSVAALEVDGRDAEARALEAADGLDTIAAAAAAAAAGTGDGAGPLLAGYTSDLIRFAGFMPDPARGAAVAARVAAHALAGGDEAAPGYDQAYAAERHRQASWLRTRLGL